MRKLLWLGLGVLAIAIAGCSKPQGTVQSASEHLGASETQSISFSGSGKAFNFGQPFVPGDPWPEFQLISYEASMSFDGPASRIQTVRKAVINPTRGPQPEPPEQRGEMLLSSGYAWFVPGKPVGIPQNWPASVDERTMEVISTPQGFLRAAAANKATETEVAGGGREVAFTLGDRLRFTGKINAANEVERVQTIIDLPVTGDTQVEYAFSDYRDFNGLRFPARIVRTQGGAPVLDINVAAVTKNPQVAITAPDEVRNAVASAPNLRVEEVAQGVYFLGSSHNSLVIDQADHIVVVEAPLSERQANAVIEKAKELVPGKPIRYVINSHVHFDHSGGLRTFVDEGATIVTHEVNKPYYEKIWANPHTLVPDRLSKSGKAPVFETFADKHVLTDGKRPIEVHLLAGNGHADGFAMVYLPNEKIISQADAYTPRPADAGPPAQVNPYAMNVYENIERLKLDVETIAPLHGRVAKIADMRRDLALPEKK